MSLPLIIPVVLSAAMLAVAVLLAVWVIEAWARHSSTTRRTAVGPAGQAGKPGAGTFEAPGVGVSGVGVSGVGVSGSGASGSGASTPDTGRRRSDNRWMAYYFAGLAVVLVVALVYYQRHGFLLALRTMEGRAFHRSDLLDITAFLIAAVIYPFLVRSFLERRRRRRSAATSSGGTGRHERVTCERPSSPRRSPS